MKKVINGHMYSTDTAKRLAKFTSRLSVSDFGYYEEALFLTKSGQFFLYGEGNAASPYARQIERSTWGSGEKIIPLTEQEAREWGERNLDRDEYEQVFGEVDSDVTGVFVQMPKALLDRVDAAATAAGITRTAYIAAALRAALSR